MGRPKRAKSGHNLKVKSTANTFLDTAMEELHDDIDTFHKHREKIPLDVNDDLELSEDEMEEPVFNLRADKSDDSEGMGSDESDADEDQLTGLAAKMAKQAKFLRQKTTWREDEDSEEEEKTEREKAAWGKQKRMYYNADNVDYELQSSDEESPAEEEAEALRLQRIKAKSLRPEDFGLDEEDQFKSHEETFQDIVQRTEIKDGQRKPLDFLHRSAGKVIGNDENIFVEEVRKDLNALSKEEQMEVVMSDAPELVGLLMELREGLDELQNKIEPVLSKVKGGNYATKRGINYLEIKHMLLLCYCQSILFYLLLKGEGLPVRDHPVIARLVEIRVLLEKIRPVDMKLQDQIEKLLKLVKGSSFATGESDSAAENGNVMNCKSKPDMLVLKTDQNVMENGDVYQPPMIIPTAMHEKKFSTSRKSTVLEEKTALQEASREFADELEGRPEEIKEIIGTESKEMLREKERLEACVQHEEFYTRMPVATAEKQKEKRLKGSKNRLLGILDDFDDDVADLEEDQAVGVPPADLLKRRKLSELIAAAGKQSKLPKLGSGDADIPVKDDIGERRAKLELQKMSKLQKHEDKEVTEDEHELEEDEFYQEAKKLKAAKQAFKATKYARPTSILKEEEGAEGKRHISYEMEKNRGLTPYRKKLTKNPRKKYKVKHNKAVIRRKGQVREVKLPQGAYGGETTGIRTNISRSIRFQG